MSAPPGPAPTAPRYALGVLGLTVALFVVASSLDVEPAFAALTGCVLLLIPRVRRRDVTPLRLLTEASPGFCLFVLALSIVRLRLRVEGVQPDILVAGCQSLGMLPHRVHTAVERPVNVPGRPLRRCRRDRLQHAYHRGQPDAAADEHDRSVR